MSQDNLIKMECTECKRIGYYTYKNMRKLRGHRLELKKHCKHCKKHTAFKESK
ncbi:MAG: 50S ribosomal protein L33 [Candidatus Kerfeldbacteria bacterium]